MIARGLWQKARQPVRSQGQLLPFARAAQLITDIYGMALLPGTLAAWVSDALWLETRFNLPGAE